SPVDGVVSQAGILERGSCLQAKGIQFPVDRLLDDADLAARFALGGAYATLYLSPRDYHRVHAPVAGAVVSSRYLPGEFWPVNPATVRNQDALFCVNERLVTVLDTPLFGRVRGVRARPPRGAGPRAAPDARPPPAGRAAGLRASLPPLPVEKGAELGRFEMGSTVILLFEPGRVVWDDRLVPEAVVRMGRRIGGAP